MHNISCYLFFISSKLRLTSTSAVSSLLSSGNIVVKYKLAGNKNNYWHSRQKKVKFFYLPIVMVVSQVQ